MDPALFAPFACYSILLTSLSKDSSSQGMPSFPLSIAFYCLIRFLCTSSYHPPPELSIPSPFSCDSFPAYPPFPGSSHHCQPLWSCRGRFGRYLGIKATLACSCLFLDRNLGPVHDVFETYGQIHFISFDGYIVLY